ncbi:MAG: 5-(carboxyamino)imidazole ribonucleotide mutase [Limnochordia bacterium]|jgi:5-(carboxyamino)imidazole ribonucleotide mutase
MNKPLVGIVMGSDSDWEVMQKAAHALSDLQVPAEVRVLSAHRTPEAAACYAKEAEGRGLRILIAGAGRAAHLPGVLASYTVLPVIGVPIRGGALAGVDALYAIVQMPSGIPVATMAIDGAHNAALFATQLLALTDPSMRERLLAYRQEMAAEVLAKDARLAKEWRQK